MERGVSRVAVDGVVLAQNPGVLLLRQRRDEDEFLEAFGGHCSKHSDP